jgi:hypothetical protein
MCYQKKVVWLHTEWQQGREGPVEDAVNLPMLH